MGIEASTAVIFLGQFLILVLIFTESSSAGLWNSSQAKKSCLQLLSECRKNHTCHSTYRFVKKKCASSAGRICFASREMMHQCADDVDWLRNEKFGEECKCHIQGMNLKKIRSCSEIHNMLYANPCYDHGVIVREEMLTTATVPTMTVVATETYDVIRKSSNVAYNAEQNQSLSNREEAELHTKISTHRGGFELEPDLDMDQAPLRRSNIFVRKHPEILERSFSTGHHPLTRKGRKPPFVQAPKNGEINYKSNFAARQNYKHFSNTTESDFKIKEILKEMLSSSGMPTHSDSFRDKADENTAQKFDPNAEEVARVVAKYMGGYDVTETSANSTVKNTQKLNQQDLAVAEPSHHDDTNPQRFNNIISLIVLVATSFCLAIFVLAIFAGLCYRRWKTKGYISKIFMKKTCHHSAIIISSLYEDRKRDKNPESV